MKVSKVSYRRTKQVARYEPEVIELEIQLTGRDTVSKAVRLARATVAREFGESPCPKLIASMKKTIEDYESIETFK